ncbi:Dextranase [Bienertia sinuspersici]
MASSSSNQPTRSISLPSRPHPLVPQIDEHFSRLRSSEVASTSVSQLSSLGHKLNILKDLYSCYDNLILLPQNQQKIVQLPDATCIDELLDGSLRLLDVCGIVKDVLSQVTEHVQEIQSSLRRRSNPELSIGDEIVGYISMRKTTKVVIKRCSKDVKEGEAHHDNVAMIGVLREIEEETAEIFESLLEAISGSKAQSHKRGASLSVVMCKLIMYHSDAYEEEVEESKNEFEDVDSNLSSLVISQKKRSCLIPNVVQAENFRKKLVKLDSAIQDLDEVLEGLFRCLVKTRATLLNIRYY